MTKPKTALARPGELIGTIAVTARAKALEADILVRKYTGSTVHQIAQRYGLKTLEIEDCIAAASNEAHEKAYEKASHYPDMAKQTLRGFAPRAAEIVKEIAEDTEAKAGTRLNAAITALDAAGAAPKSPGTVNLNFPVLSKEDLKELVGAAVSAGIGGQVSSTPTPEADVTDLDPEPEAA